MTSLRHRLTEDMQIRNLAVNTQHVLAPGSLNSPAISTSHPSYWDLSRFAPTRSI